MMKIAMAQINPIVGDLEGNVEKIRQNIRESKKKEVDLVAFPELAVTGYPPQDLLYVNGFVEENKRLLEKIVKESSGITAAVGFVDYDPSRKGSDGTQVKYNSAAVIKDGELMGVQHKTLLPTYDVFDEDRYFMPAIEHRIFDIDNARIGIEICEDLWDEGYGVEVTKTLADKGANLILNLSASPYYAGKRFIRQKLLQKKAKENSVSIFYVNCVGGQDELVFDGQSLAVDKLGDLIAIGKQFEEDLVTTYVDLEKGLTEKISPPPYRREQEMFNAIVLGIRDYFRKTNFKKAVVGMSGGIDSSLSTCLSVEALGKENVVGVSMPSKFSSKHSKTDAQKLAENLGICFVQFSIQDIVNAYHITLENPLEEIRKQFGIKKESDDPVADENIQPRIRGNCLMDISNRLKDLGILVVNTGNKTELALGYCTLYGDMAGGIGALGDVSKLEVYKLARYVNEKAGREIIPKSVFEKKPSPELKEGQFDPFDFDAVSPLVDEIIENRRSRQELIEMGYPQEIVEDTYRRVRNAEYKRWQAAPCIKITPKAFGIGWKMPIVNDYRG
jgi:NAD+ synthase (glutamine-hydrolysing)